MLVTTIIAARWTIRRFAVSSALGPRAAVGLVALGMLLIAEVIGARWLRGLSIPDYVAGFFSVAGGITHRRPGLKADTEEGGSAADDGERVAGDHQLLVGRDHPRRRGAAPGADAGPAPLVGDFIEAEPEPRRIPAHTRTDRRGVLADPAGEHEGVEAAESGGERAELAADSIDEHGERPGRAGRVAREKVTDVGAQA